MQYNVSIRIWKAGRLMEENTLFYYKNANQIFPFSTPKKTACTSPLNGGISTNIKAAVNINCLGANYECKMLGETYEEDLAEHVKQLGLDPDSTVALSTAAWTEQAAVIKQAYKELTVTAVATGSIDHNGMRVGDPTKYYELDGTYYPAVPGTINLFLFVNQKMTDAAMLRSLVLCGEAKAAAVQELLMGSCFSEDLSTGSGTDGIVIIAEQEAEHTCTDASGHSKLGELIGQCTKQAVKQALKNLSAASPARQFQVLKRTERFGITVGSLWDFYQRHEEDMCQIGVTFSCASDMEQILMQYNQNSNALLVTSLYVHLMDQLRWGMIMQAEALREGKRLLLMMLHITDEKYLMDFYSPDVPEAFAHTEDMKTQFMYLFLQFLSLKQQF